MKQITLCTLFLIALLVACGFQRSAQRVRIENATDQQITEAAARIWKRREREAWDKLERTKVDPACHCGESYEYIEARSRWSDIRGAERYFERMLAEAK